MSRPMTPFVMFGQNPYFGDFADVIHSVGGWLAKVVVNVPDVPKARSKSFVQRVEEYQSWLDRHHAGLRCEVVQMDDFTPSPGEECLMGFRGLSLKKGLREVKGRFDVEFKPLVHATAYVSPMATLMPGVLVGPGAVVASFVEVGEHSLINRGVTVGHDTTIGRYCFVSPSAALASGIKMGDQVVIGINATVIDGLEVGEGCHLGGGAVLVKDAPAWTVMAGVPAKVLKERERPTELPSEDEEAE